jgi:hypothetical protein
VAVKTKALNFLYSTQIRAVNVAATHICSLAIDADLKAGKPEIVDRIAKMEMANKRCSNFFLSLASIATGTTRLRTHLRRKG